MDRKNVHLRPFPPTFFHQFVQKEEGMKLIYSSDFKNTFSNYISNVRIEYRSTFDFEISCFHTTKIPIYFCFCWILSLKIKKILLRENKEKIFIFSLKFDRTVKHLVT